jgi:hypothetical protein
VGAVSGVARIAARVRPQSPIGDLEDMLVLGNRSNRGGREHVSHLFPVRPNVPRGLVVHLHVSAGADAVFAPVDAGSPRRRATGNDRQP